MNSIILWTTITITTLLLIAITYCIILIRFYQFLVKQGNNPTGIIK